MALYLQVARAATTLAPVLPARRDGRGKEWVARAIHRHGARAQGPSCRSTARRSPKEPSSRRSSATRAGASPARRARGGADPSAHGGTLFLDEVGDAAAAAPGRLSLRVLQDGEFGPWAPTR